jgi:hypothetical protein
MRKAKQIEYLISVLPSPTEDETANRQFAALEAELQDANKEYKDALAVAGPFAIFVPPFRLLTKADGECLFRGLAQGARRDAPCYARLPPTDTGEFSHERDKAVKIASTIHDRPRASREAVGVPCPFLL